MSVANPNLVLLAQSALNAPEIKAVGAGSVTLCVALKKLDVNNPADGGNDNEKVARHKKFAPDAKKLPAIGQTYAQTIDAAINVVSKGLNPNEYRALKLLRKHLDVVVSAVGVALASYTKKQVRSDARTVTKTGQKRNEMLQEGRGNDEIRAAVHFIQQQTAMKVFPAASKSALAKARAAIQKIKSNPTKAGYDAAMDDGARALTQVCSNLAKLMDNAQCPAKLRSSLIGLKAVSRELDEFGGGAKRTVPDGTQSAAILLLNKEFKRHVDAAEQFFPIVVEFLKKHKL